MNKHPHRTTPPASMKIMLLATLLCCGGLAAADEFKGNLLFPWEAHGKVYDAGPDTLMFVGEIEGTLYAESGQAALDAAFMICPMLYEIDTASGETRGEGRCAIYPKDVGAVIYATYSCRGQIGACAGRLDLTGGKGKFEGISGSGDMSSRTGASALAVRLGPGGGITNAEGMMTLNGFAYRTP
ncbi:MAG: hypothetical protein MUC79_03950 [Thiobacillaceae bacterium]|jgi:hypothetical protein|nr:hypothetical protein [Thiobacillaceae bacterium]